MAFIVVVYVMEAAVMKGVRSGFVGSGGVAGGDMVKNGMICVMLFTFVSGRCW